MGIVIRCAQPIPEESWLNDDAYGDTAAFRRGYAYAMTQTHAIDALAKCHPTEIYHAWAAIQRGIALEVTDV